MRLKKYLKPKKGRGIGYKGAKRLIAFDIGEEIEFQVLDFDIFVDAFGGGGSMFAEFLMRGKQVVYNDFDYKIYSAFKHVMTEKLDYADLILTRDEFYKLKETASEPIDYLKLYVNSFGNKAETFLYAEDIADIKVSLAKEILIKEGTFERYRQTETYNNALWQLDRQQRLQQLERLEQLKQLRKLQHRNLKIQFHNLDYKEFIISQRNKRAVLYCDIPYIGTSGYDVDFNHDEFCEFIKNESDNFAAIFISSYELPGFKMIREFNKTSSLQGGNHNSSDKQERLFTLPDFEEARQMNIFDYLD